MSSLKSVGSKSWGFVLGACALIIAALVFIQLVTALVWMVVWNFVATPVFDLPAIDFWQSLAIIIMVSIIGSFFRSYGTKS